MNISQLLRQAPINKRDATYILMHVLGMDQVQILTSPNLVIDHENVEIFNKMAEQVASDTPMEYVINTAFFMGLDFYVNGDVLIPRNDTEILVEEAIRHIKATNAKTVLDMCTGSGCILISLLHHTKAQGVGVDISHKALDIAKKNAIRNNVISKAEFILSDMFNNIKKVKKGGSDAGVSSTCKFDMIISNPPYIPTAHIPALDHSVKAHEPYLALDGGLDGLNFYHILAEEAGAFLNPGGAIFLEIGHDQGESVKGIYFTAGYSKVTIKKDYAGHDRIAVILA